jgi:hypothetical protein
MKCYVTILLMPLLAACKGRDSPFVANRVQQSTEITLEGPIEKVFPLFGIIREKEWEPEWKPDPIFPLSGDIAEGAIYCTPGHLPGEAPLTWVVVRYDTVLYRLTYLVSASDRIVSIDIQCITIDSNHTRAIVTYTLTGLTQEGNKIIRHHLASIFAHNLQGWENAINQLLKRSL